MNKSSKARLIALYLPQYHPIPENDAWWGAGFTEWTNTAKAKPMFPGHYQPHLPSDLGFYDLRCPESRKDQAELARASGIEGFCYWHYWFGGKRLLERPFNEVLTSGEPDFPFCLAWANESWSGIWHGTPNRVLMEQTYPGREDHENHFEYLLKAFSDPRYITVDGKPLFLVYRPNHLPDAKQVTDLWREMAIKAGLKGLYLVACLHSEPTWKPETLGFDAATLANQVKIMEIPPRSVFDKWKRQFINWYRTKRGWPVKTYRYEDALPYLVQQPPPDSEIYPTVVPNWDNTPRSGLRGFVLHGSTPELWRRHLRDGIDVVQDYSPEHRLVFVKSWNEWAEGNHLEPDMKYGHAYLDVVRQEMGVSSK